MVQSSGKLVEVCAEWTSSQSPELQSESGSFVYEDTCQQINLFEHFHFGEFVV
jgi:hypothetical protein